MSYILCTSIWLAILVRQYVAHTKSIAISLAIILQHIERKLEYKMHTRQPQFGILTQIRAWKCACASVCVSVCSQVIACSISFVYSSLVYELWPKTLHDLALPGLTVPCLSSSLKNVCIKLEMICRLSFFFSSLVFVTGWMRYERVMRLLLLKLLYTL